MSGSIMVDWLTLEVPDPFGTLIHGGQVCKIDVDGVVEWNTRCKAKAEGSWSSRVEVRNLMADRTEAAGTGLQLVKRSGLELSGNPAKFMQGHNLFGDGDVSQVAESFVRAVAAVPLPGVTELPADFHERDLSVDDAEISRIDITSSWLLDRAEDVLPFLRAMEDRVWCPYRGRGVQSNPGTLYYGLAQKGKRAKDWQLKIYAKGMDIVAHPLPPVALQVPGLLDEVNRTVRVELTLRTGELKRLGLRKVGDWRGVDPMDIWRRYVDRLNFGDGDAMRLDIEDLAGLGLKPRHVHAIAAWMAGNDMRAGLSRPTFYRIRKEIRDATGIDIATAVPKSNVIPLRRVIEARPALKPRWADHLTAALREAA